MSDKDVLAGVGGVALRVSLRIKLIPDIRIVKEYLNTCSIVTQYHAALENIYLYADDRLRAGRGTARSEDALGTPIQSHVSPSILLYEDKTSSL